MTKTLTGTFQLPSGGPVAFGTLYLKLTQDATVIGTGQIVPATPLAFPLDINGTLGSGITIFASDELNPAGVSYVLTVAEQGGGQVYGPEFFVISGVSPINLNNLTPTASSPVVFSTAILSNPTATQTITGFPLVVFGIQSGTPNAATGFILGLASVDNIAWRNNANSANVSLGKNSNDSLTFNGFVSPQVVAAVNLTGQTASITSTVLYAVPASGAGLYRVSMQLVITTVGTGGSIQPVITYNNGTAESNNWDAVTPITSVGNDMENTSGSVLSSTTKCYFLAASTNINYQVNFNTVTGSPQYSLKIRLEYLG